MDDIDNDVEKSTPDCETSSIDLSLSGGAGPARAAAGDLPQSAADHAFGPRNF
jgi:hypothetical protein